MTILQKLLNFVEEYHSIGNADMEGVVRRAKQIARAHILIKLNEPPFEELLNLNLDTSNDMELDFGTVRVRASLRFNYIVSIDYTALKGATDADRLIRQWLDSEPKR